MLPVVLFLLFMSFSSAVEPIPGNVTYFDCPKAQSVLNTTLGDPDCGDHPRRGSICDLPVYPSSTCSFMIESITGTVSIALLHITANNIGFSDSISIDGIYDKVIALQSSLSLRAALPTASSRFSPIVTINVNAVSRSNMTFGYYIERLPLPTFSTPLQISLEPGQLAQFIQTFDAKAPSSWEVTASKQVNVFPAVNSFTSPFDFLNFWLYNGIGENKTLAGSLFSKLNSGTSTDKNQITIEYVLQTDQFMGVVLLNDLANLANCGEYYTVFWALPSDFEVGANIYDKTGCITVINEVIDGRPLYYMGVPNDYHNGTIPAVSRIISGGPVTDPDAINATLALYNNDSAFTPSQVLSGYARTFVFHGTNVMLSFSRDVTTGDPYTPYNLRSGFIATNNYGYNSTVQKVLFELVTDHNFNLTFTIKNCMPSDGYMIKVSNQSQDLQYIFPGNTTQTTFSYIDFLLIVIVDFIDTINGSGQGCLLTYTTYDVPAPTTTGGTTAASNVTTSLATTTSQEAGNTMSSPSQPSTSSSKSTFTMSTTPSTPTTTTQGSRLFLSYLYVIFSILWLFRN